MAKSSGSSGIGIGTILFIIFLVLKLTDNIDWSWWWVTSPLWIPASLIIVLSIFCICILGPALFFTKLGENLRK